MTERKRTLRRYFAKLDLASVPEDYSISRTPHLQEFDKGASLLSSLLFEPNTNKNRRLWAVPFSNGTLHAPVLDLDYPAELLPSKTPGHFHLVLSRPMTWGKYKKLLMALAEAGVIEEAYAQHSLDNRASFIRRPNEFQMEVLNAQLDTPETRPKDRVAHGPYDNAQWDES